MFTQKEVVVSCSPLMMAPALLHCHSLDSSPELNQKYPVSNSSRPCVYHAVYQAVYLTVYHAVYNAPPTAAVYVLLLWFAVVSLCSLLFHVCFTVSGGKCEYVYTCKLQRFIIKFSATWVHVCFLWFKIIFTFFPSFSLSSIIKCYLLICLVKCPQERKQNPLPFYGCQMKCCLTSSVGVGSV